MMLAEQFATSAEYRAREFQTTPFDRPLVCHFAANSPAHFAAAARLAAPHCDAIDLNLGCPQRTAFVGHFGSYLLDPPDRQLILDIVAAGARAVAVPIFVKIRLLDGVENTVELVRQLYGAGASLVAVHGRYRASFERKGPGARDGPALLDQIRTVKSEACPPGRALVTNGNTVTYDDVVKNLDFTRADGIMSAEGILDNPALYLGRLGPHRDDSEGTAKAVTTEEETVVVKVKGGAIFDRYPDKKKYLEKLRKIEIIKEKLAGEKGSLGASASKRAPSDKERKKLSREQKIRSKLAKIDEEAIRTATVGAGDDGMVYSETTLQELHDVADDNVRMAAEYLQLVRQYPATLRTVIFHTRRILKAELTKYQLMSECLACRSVDDVEGVVNKIRGYRNDPASFQYDKEKAQEHKEALERKRREEGKRKAYEARMVRKAKREGRSDPEHYLRQGTAVPTAATIRELRRLGKAAQLEAWKERQHSQHCMAFHLDEGGCPRGRACAFLHTASRTPNAFDEKDEVAG